MRKEQQNLYEFEIYCDSKDFNEIMSRIGDIGSVGWYNFVPLELIKNNGSIDEGAEIFGICLPIGIKYLKTVTGNNLNYYPVE